MLSTNRGLLFMGGVLGGLLEGVNYVGGVVLRCLIGEAARKPNRTARWARLLIGSMPCGLLLSAILIAAFELAGWPESFDSNRMEMRIYFGILGPLTITVFAVSLELLRESIETDEP